MYFEIKLNEMVLCIFLLLLILIFLTSFFHIVFMIVTDCKNQVDCVMIESRSWEHHILYEFDVTLVRALEFFP